MQFKSWWMLGALQMTSLIFFSACEPTTGVSMAEAAAPSDAATPRAGASEKPSYLRISRAFFEEPLEATIRLKSENGDAKAFESAIRWIEYPPTAPAPQADPELGEVLADFRDFVACAEMQALGEARLCFNVMPDVSSLGLNDNEMTLRGVESIQAASSETNDCSASSARSADAGRYRLTKATRSETSLELEFAPVDGCGSSVELTLKQLP